MSPLVVLPLLLAAAPLESEDAAIILHAGRLFDGMHVSLREKVSVIVEGGRVTGIRDGYVEVPVGARVIDLKGMTVLPGLIDCHTHISSERSPRSYAEPLFMNPADYALRAVIHARRTLEAGFTAIRDLGDRYDVSISLRDAIRQGWVVGPRIYTAGKAIATTGGHADPTNGHADAFTFVPGPEHGVVDGPYEARAAVRQRYKDGADLIKITATGGVLSLAKSGDNPQFRDDELAAIVETARDYGMKIAVHAHGAKGMKRALRAGVSSIEHGTYMDDEAIALFRKNGAYYVPTLLAGAFVAEKAKVDGYFPEVVRPKAARIGRDLVKTFAKAHRAGVKIAFGTDSGVSAHGDNAQELVLMVNGGMSPVEALLAATREAAALIGDPALGRIGPGAYADIIAVDGDPSKDIAVLLDVDFVMKGGAIVVAPGPS